jgi:hypothetical protein
MRLVAARAGAVAGRRRLVLTCMAGSAGLLLLARVRVVALGATRVTGVRALLLGSMAALATGRCGFRRVR